jgi:hypothetical protein
VQPPGAQPTPSGWCNARCHSQRASGRPCGCCRAFCLVSLKARLVTATRCFEDRVYLEHDSDRNSGGWWSGHVPCVVALISETPKILSSPRLSLRHNLPFIMSSEAGEESLDMFQEPTDFYQPEKQATFASHQLLSGKELTVRLVGHNPLWVSYALDHRHAEAEYGTCER